MYNELQPVIATYSECKYNDLYLHCLSCMQSEEVAPVCASSAVSRGELTSSSYRVTEKVESCVLEFWLGYGGSTFTFGTKTPFNIILTQAKGR